MPRGIYDRNKKQKEEAPQVDPVKLQFPKPKKNQPFGICRNRARNVEKALKDEK